MYHVQVVGAGYTGSRIAAYFKEKKQKVWAVTRSGSRRAEFEAAGITPVTADLSRPEDLVKIPPAHFIVLSPAPSGHEESDYRALYLDGIGNYLASLEKRQRPSLIVYISSTSVWRERDGAWVDENSPPDSDSPKGKILAEAERKVLESGYPSLIFRCAGIYGPGRNRIRPLKGGIWPAAGEADAWMNMIHVDDIVRAMPVLFKKGQAGEIYTGVDDEPVLRSTFCPWLAGKLGIEGKYSFRPGAPQGKRCANAKLKALGYSFSYPSFQEGYEKIMENSSS